MNRIVRVSVLAALSLATAFVCRTALADGGSLFQLDSGASKLTYTIVHKLHTVEGTSQKADGKALLKPDGTVQVQIVAPVTSFMSGSSGRDEHMQETMEATKFPNVGFKGFAHITPPTDFPSTVKTTFEGKLDFHGMQQSESIPVELTFKSATEVHVTSTFNVSLDKYKVDRPSLLLIKINDDCKIDLDLTLKQ